MPTLPAWLQMGGAATEAHGHRAQEVKRPVTKSWQLYDGKNCGTITTIHNRIISAPPIFRRYIGQLMATLPLTTKVTPSEPQELHINRARQPDGGSNRANAG